MFSKMKLGMRVMAALAAMVVIVIGLSVFGVRQIQQADDSDTVLYDANTKPLELAGALMGGANRAYTNLLQATLSADSGLRKRWLDKAATRIRDAEATLPQLVERIAQNEFKTADGRSVALMVGLDPSKTDALNKSREDMKVVTKSGEALLASLKAAVAKAEDGKVEAVVESAVNGDLAKVRDEFNGALTDLTGLLSKRGSIRAETNTENATKAIFSAGCSIATFRASSKDCLPRLTNW